MNLHYEFSKVKNGFLKVKNDMEFLATKISDNYEVFIKKHETLATEIKHLSDELKTHIESLSKKDIKKLTEKEFLDIRTEIKELKEHIEIIQKNHNDVISTIDTVKQNKKSIKDVKDDLKSSKLEMFLLKERILEKDQEIKQIKEINKHMFSILEDLSRTELEIMTKKKAKK